MNILRTPGDRWGKRIARTSISSALFFASLLGLNAQLLWQPSDVGMEGASVQNVGISSGGAVFVTTTTGVYRLSDAPRSWDRVDGSNRWRQVWSSPSGAIFSGDSLLRSEDGGNTWTPALSAIVGGLAMNSAGAGIATTQLGPYVTTDDGRSWTPVTALPFISHVATDGDRLVAATDDAIFISTDDGSTWNAVMMPTYSVYSLAANSSGILFSGEEGMFQSTDGGESWTLLSEWSIPEVQAVPDGSYLILSDGFANGMENDGLWKLNSVGTKWQHILSRYVSAFRPDGDGGIWAAGYSHILHSSDGGATWSNQDLDLSGATVSLPIAGPSGVLYAERDEDLIRAIYPPGFPIRSLYRSDDGGATWTALKDSLGVDFDVYSDGRLAATALRIKTPDQSLVQVPVTSTNRGMTWKQGDVLSHAGTNVLVVTEPSIPYGARVRVSGDGGATWNEHEFQVPILGVRMTSTGAVLVAVSGDDLSDGYIHRIYHSSDAGLSWDIAADDLPVLSMYTAGEGAFYAVALDEATGTLRLYRSTDDGASWELSGPTALPLYRGLVVARDGRVYYETSDGASMRSDDGGATWTELQPGPNGVPVTNLAVTRDGVLYGLDSNRPVRSVDGGGSWTVVDAGLPPSGVVRGIAVMPDDHLFVSLWGGGLYRATHVPLAVPGEEHEAGSVLALDAVRPNPVVSAASVSFRTTRAGDADLVLYDLRGEVAARVTAADLGPGEHRIDIRTDGLAAGAYLLRLSSGGEVRSRLIVVQ